MSPNPYLKNGLKYATLTLLGIVVIIAGSALMRGKTTGSLTGRLVSQQEQGITPTVKFDQNRAIDGFAAPADTNVIFTVPNGVRITRIAFFGGPDYDEQRYWGYCYSGNEARNKQNGLMGRAVYDGQFFYSLGERKAQTATKPIADNDLVGILNSTTALKPSAPASIAEILNGGQTCYVMSQVILSVGIDTDNDDFNNNRERDLGTDPNNPDSDGDGIKDGIEVFRTKTNPKLRDTDGDGLPEMCEDKNADGLRDSGETSPLNPDTDRDGLCDGNGSASGCPEPKQTFCTMQPNGERDCDSRPSTPVYGEDMNQNCKVDNGETDPTNDLTFGIADWDYKWNKLMPGTSDSARGVTAPEFPIPGLPSVAPGTLEEQMPIPEFPVEPTPEPTQEEGE